MAERSGRTLRTLVTLLVVALLLGAAQALRTQLGIEWSAESIRASVGRLGLWAPAGYLVLVLFRQFLALPSVVVLTAAGLLFGAGPGTLLGGLGLSLNAILLFATARLMGRDWVMPRIHERWPDMEERAKAAGPPFIALMTGHPMGVLTPFHFAAGATGISWPAFLAAVLPTAPLRAACYSFLGANLLDPGSARFWAATAILVLFALLPFAHPAVRRRLRVRSPQAPPAQ